MELKKRAARTKLTALFVCSGCGADNHLPWIWAALRRANKAGKELTTGLCALARDLCPGCEDELSFI